MQNTSPFIILILFVLFSCNEDDLYSLVEESIERQLEKRSAKGSDGVACIGNYHKFDFPKAGNVIVEQRPDFLWGINTHSLRLNDVFGYNNQYREYTFSNQMDFFKELNVDVLRLDVHAGENGIYYEIPAEFEELLIMLEQNDMKMLPVIHDMLWKGTTVNIGNNWDIDLVRSYINSSNSNAIKSLYIWKYYYAKAQTIGKKFAELYGDRLDYYQVGNETAHYIISFFQMEENNTNMSNADYFYNNYGGDNMSDFFVDEEYGKRTVASAAFFSGFINGAKQNDASGKFIFNDTRKNYGYIEFLNLMGTNYDIIGWNWYSSFGNFADVNGGLGVNVYEELNTISGGKPIWITEFNRTCGSEVLNGNGVAEEDQAIKIRTTMESMFQLENVQAFMIYELIDMDYSSQGSCTNYFGLIRSPFQLPNNPIKPAYNTYRFSIEEFKYGYHDLLYSYYLKYKNEDRDLDDSVGIEPWSTYLSNGNSWTNFLNSKLEEDSKYFIEQTFLQILDRNASTTDINNYRNSMINHEKTREGVIKNIGASIECFNKAQTQVYSIPGDSARNFIKHICRKLLYQEDQPTNFEINAYLISYPSLSTNSQSRSDFIQNEILNSVKYRTKFIKDQFLIYLERPVDNSGLNGYLNNWSNQKNILISILNSDEFWRKSVIRGYCKRHL